MMKFSFLLNKPLIGVLSFLLASAHAFSQSPCGNIGFTSSNLNGWTGAKGTSTACFPSASGVVNGNFQGPNDQTPDTNETSNYFVNLQLWGDPLTQFQLPCYHSAGKTLRLGNANSLSEYQKLEYTFVVDSSNAALQYYYAVVMNNDGSGVCNSAGMTLGVYDSNNNLLTSSCASTTINNTSPGFITTTYTVNGYPVKFLPWTCSSTDLLPYVGQQVTLRLATYDGPTPNQFCYAYFDFDCAPLRLSSQYCDTLTLCMQGIYCSGVSYQWFDANGNLVGTADTLCITQFPPINYSVQIMNTQGCYVTQYWSYNLPVINLNPVSTPQSSPTASDGTATVTPNGGIPPYTYLWQPSGQTTQTATGLDPGTYTVVVTDAMGCTSTAVIVIGTLGEEEDPFFQNLNLFPNPGMDLFTLEISLKDAAEVNIEVFNVVSSRIHSQSLRSSAFYKEVINLSEQPPGCYFVRVSSKGRSVSRKIILMDH